MSHLFKKASLLVLATLLVLSSISGLALATDTANAQNQGIGRWQARQIARSVFPNVRVLRVEADSGFGVSLWNVYLRNGMEVYLRQSDGFVMEIERWSGQPTQDNRTIIPVWRARRIAQSLYPETTVVEVDRYNGRGYRYFEIELSNNMEVYVHRATGELIEVGPVYEDDED